jgi:hypothetical protein
MISPFSAQSSSHGRFFVGIALGFLLGIGACYGFGYFATSYHPIEESKLCYLALTDHSDRLQPQTREYLKARLYSNAAIWVRPSWMAGWQLDFGPVDDAALGGVIAIKDASSTAEIYQAALTKHGITPKVQ